MIQYFRSLRVPLDTILVIFFIEAHDKLLLVWVVIVVIVMMLFVDFGFLPENSLMISFGFIKMAESISFFAFWNFTDAAFIAHQNIFITQSYLSFIIYWIWYHMISCHWKCDQNFDLSKFLLRLSNRNGFRLFPTISHVLIDKMHNKLIKLMPNTSIQPAVKLENPYHDTF